MNEDNVNLGDLAPAIPETFLTEIRLEVGGRWWQTEVTADEYCQILKTGTLAGRYIAEIKLFGFGTNGSYISMQPHDFDTKYLIGDSQGDDS